MRHVRFFHTVSLAVGLWLASPGRAAHAGDEGWLAYPYLEAPVEELAAALDAFEARMGELTPHVEGTEEARTNDVAILLTEWGHRYDEQGRQTLVSRRIYRVLTEGGVEAWDPMVVGWEPWHEARPELRVRVIHTDGEVHRLDPDAVVVGGGPEPGVKVYSDNRELLAPLPALEVGAIVEQVVEIREERPYFAPGRNLTSELTSYEPTAVFSMWVEQPEGAPFAWTLHGEAELETSEQPLADGGLRHGFLARDITPWDEWVNHLPFEVWLYPAIEFSTADSWGAVAQGYHAMVRGALDHAGTAQAIAPVMTEAFSDTDPATLGRDERTARLLAALRDRIRYTGLNLGEAAIVPGTPAETLERSYGDSEDQATLLVALLEAVDIQAHVALISTVDGYDPTPTMPGLDSFDHAIVVIPGPEPTWIDPVDHFARTGALAEECQGRLALIAAPDTTEPTRTPQSPSSENRLTHVVHIELPFNGAARVTEQQWGTGPQEIYLRRWGSYRKQVEQERADTDAPAEPDEETWEQTDPDDLGSAYRWTSTSTDEEVGAVGGGVAWVPLYEGTLFEHSPWDVWHEPDDDAEPREQALAWPPFSVELRYELVPPPGYELVEEPRATEKSLGPAQYRRTVSHEDGTLVVVSTLDWPHARITPEQFAEAQEAFVALAEGAAATVTYKHGAQIAWEGGDPQGASQAYRELVRAWPDEPQPKLDLSEFLMANTLAPAARRWSDQAVAQTRDGDPQEYARVLHSTAWTYTQDDLGNYGTGGYDRDAALRVWRQAQQASPDNPRIAVGLGVALRHDDHGVLLKPGHPDRIAGMELLLATVDMEGADADIHDLALRTLIEDERYQIALETAKRLPATDATRSTILVCLCLLQGSEAAMGSPEWKRMDQAQRQMAVGLANLTLLGMRRYPEAIDMIQAVPATGADALRAQQVMPLLQALKPWRELHFDPKDPTEVAERFLILSADEDTKLPELMALFTRGSDPEEIEGERRAMRFGAEAGMREMGVAGMSIGFLPDILAILVDGEIVEQHGNDALVRLQMMGPTPSGTLDLDFAMVREGRRWKIRAARTLLRHQGAAEALSRLDKGAPDEALRWLTWVAGQGDSRPPDDPWDGALLTHLMHGLAADDPERLHMVATAVLAAGGEAPQAVAELERLRAQATDPVQRVILGRCLSWALEQADDDEALVALFTQLHREYPDADRPLAGLLGALGRLNRQQERVDLLRAEIERQPDNAWLKRSLAASLALLGELDEARVLMQALDRKGEATATDYNEVAWWDLIQDRVDAETVRTAERAAEQSGYRDSATLHTLACVLIDQGEVPRTIEIVQYAMQSEGYTASDLPPHWWYLIGRIAEALGEPELALETYRAIEKPEPLDGLDTWHLVERRLVSLEGAEASP